MSNVVFPCEGILDDGTICGEFVPWDKLHEYKEPGTVGRGTVYCDNCCPRCRAEQREFEETERMMDEHDRY